MPNSRSEPKPSIEPVSTRSADGVFELPGSKGESTPIWNVFSDRSKPSGMRSSSKCCTLSLRPPSLVRNAAGRSCTLPTPLLRSVLGKRLLFAYAWYSDAGMFTPS
jgi:hypothetical protein